MSIWMVCLIIDGELCNVDSWFFTEAEALAHAGANPRLQVIPLYSASPRPF